MDDLEALFVGYLILWLGLLLYTFFVHIQNQRLKKELALINDNIYRIQRDGRIDYEEEEEE